MQSIGVGFSFNGVHCDEMHCELANNDECMHAITDVFNLVSEKVDGYDGEYYAGEEVSGRDFNIELLVEDVSDEELMDIGSWIGKGKSGRLIFDHMPYKYYIVHVATEPHRNLYTGYDHANGAFTYSGKITVQMKAMSPRAYMVEEVRANYPNVGNMRHALEKGSGIIAESARPSIYGTSVINVLNAGNAPAQPEIWISGSFPSGTIVRNETTGQEFTIKGASGLYCVDSYFGRTTKWTNAQVPTTNSIYENNLLNGSCVMADDVKSGHFITIDSCYPRWRSVGYTASGSGTVTLTSGASVRMVGEHIRIGSTWYEITAVNGNTLTVSGSPSGSGSAMICKLNKIRILPGSSDTVENVAVRCEDTFY